MERDKEKERSPVPEELLLCLAVNVLAKFPKMMAKMKANSLRPAKTRAHRMGDLYTSIHVMFGYGVTKG